MVVRIGLAVDVKFHCCSLGIDESIALLKVMRLAHWLAVADVVFAAQGLRDLVVRGHHNLMSVLAVVEVEMVLSSLLVDRPFYRKILPAS
jgi:hypothetical protein